MRKILTWISLALPALASLIIASLLSVGPAQAAKHNTIELQLKHYEQCLTWMYTDPAKHAKFCGPGHEFFFNPNINSAPYADSPKFPPAVTPPAPKTCPDGSTGTPVAYVTYSDFILVGGGEGGWDHGGGGYGDDKPSTPSFPAGCTPNKPSDDCPKTYGSYGTTVGYLLTGGSYGGDCRSDEPKCWPGSFSSDGHFAPSIIDVAGYGCPGSCSSAYIVPPDRAPGIVLARIHSDDGWGCRSSFEIKPLEMQLLSI